ncbi:MAG: hypothetical protein LBN27_06685 [Prevotellaceae bacterium]|jgi:hypothetical protein|nr:hypothetical protein [Prevotellaceae bacterium]
MRKGNIKFIYEDGKTPLLEVELANNNLWLTKFEMAHLLNCFVQKVDANLRSIFKEKLLWENEVCHNNRYTDNNGKEHQMMYYNMEVLIFMSYRINTLEAKVFRQFVNSSLREKLRRDNMSETNFAGLFYFNPNFCLN